MSQQAAAKEVRRGMNTLCIRVIRGARQVAKCRLAGYMGLANQREADLIKAAEQLAEVLAAFVGEDEPTEGA